MNAWLPAIESPWQLAGWTMVHFLWIGAAVTAAGAVVRVALRRASPTLRYAASLTTLAALAVAPAAIAVWLGANAPEFRRNSATVGEFLRNSHPESRSDEAAAPVGLALTALPIVSDPAEQLQAPLDATVANPSPSPSLPGWGTPLQQAVELLPWAWLVGAPLTFAWLAAGLVGSRRLQRASSPLVDGPIADACRRLQQALGVTRRVALAVCDGLAQPVLVGIVKPTILLPASAITGWTPEELEMALVHELAHVRRWDNLVNLVQRVIESLLFFHPAVWLVSRQVRRDREECCDAIVVAQTNRPEAYATLLVTIASKLRTRSAAALALASALAQPALAGRVRRILKLEDQPMWVSRRWLAVLVAIALGLMTAVYRVAVAEPAADDAKADAADRVADETDVEESADSKPRELTPQQREQLFALAEPGDVPAAVFVFPATPEEVPRRVAELNSLGHNVRIANGDGFTVLFITNAPPPAESGRRQPHRLAPGDFLRVRVAGALPGSPIDDAFAIEDEGTIALGPIYGRVAVAGLTVLEAETAVTNHLGTMLSDPQVQVTLWEMDRDASVRGVPGPPVHGAALPTLRDDAAAAPDPPVISFPEGVDEADAKRIVADLQRQGYEARAGRRSDGSLALEIALPPGGKLVWEERMGFDGRPIEVARVVVEEPLATVVPAPYAAVGARGAPAREGGEVSADDFRYDGKTFDEWRNLWRRELKTERRIEAIAALMAFGRRAYPHEAAEAILDVAGEYDFTHDGEKPERDLKRSIVRALSYANVQGAQGIPPHVWLPILVERVRSSEGAEHQRWRELLSALLLAWGYSSPEPRDLLIELAEDGAVGVQEGAQYALARGVRNTDDPQLVRIVRASLQGPNPSIHVLRYLFFTDVDRFPEQVDVLLHADPKVQGAARALFRSLIADGDRWGELYDRLTAVIDDPGRADDHLAAMRALAVLWPYAKKHWPADTERLLMRHHRALATADESLIPTTLWLLTKITGSDAQYVISRTKEMLPEEFTPERVRLAMDAIKRLDAEERAIY